jgi:hypothetical protein
VFRVQLCYWHLFSDGCQAQTNLFL